MPALRERVYSPETRDKLMLMSALGGVAIAQTMTSLPHGMGYFLTYERGLPHGMANGVLTQAYLELFPAGDETVAKVLEYLGFASTDEMGTFLDAVLEHNSVYTEAGEGYFLRMGLPFGAVQRGGAGGLHPHACGIRYQWREKRFACVLGVYQCRLGYDIAPTALE